MSDKSRTPLTDAVMKKMPATEIWVEDLDRLASFARQLETQLAEARKDTERLDWLENSSLEIYNPETDSVSCYDLRQAIDHAMKGQDDE